MKLKDKKISIIGGCGHVGLPLGVKFSLAGAKVFLVDIDKEKIEKVNKGTFPFLEEGGDKELKLALKNGLVATNREEVCRESDVIVFITGTPVDEHLNPVVNEVLKVFEHYKKYFHDDTLIIMRSTLSPGTMEHLNKKLKENNINTLLAFCPERVAQGKGLKEIEELPQIVSSFNEKSFDAAYNLFSKISPSIIKLEPLEAELTKLMANAWRYLEFAISNQFYTISENNGVDFYKIYKAIRYKYPRANGYKSPGFAAGPCLFKDTMQLSSFVNHEFSLGQASMLVNENLTNVVLKKAMELSKGSLWGKRVGLLGMTFKANNDDTRESLSYKVKKVFEFKGAIVKFNDPYVKGSTNLKELEENSDFLVLTTPHDEYKNYKFKIPVLDVWDILNPSTLEILPGKEEV